MRCAIDARTNDGCTPLAIAIERRHYGIVKFLIERGAGLRACNGLGETAVQVAMQGGCLMIIELLLKYDGRR